MTKMKHADNQSVFWPRLYSHKLMLGCGTMLAALALQSCEKDILTGQPSWLGNSIYERLEEGIEVNGEKQTFNVVLQLIDDLEMTQVLSKTGSKTLFVASDSAYNVWFKENNTSYEQLSTAQKKMLLNNAMINNAYLLSLMSNVSGTPPLEGMCMRRATASSIYDTIPTMTVDEMPIDPMLDTKRDTWASLRSRGKDIRILKNDDAAPMIHFLPKFMSTNKITDEDLQVLSNGESNSIADAWINGRKVISEEQTCKNGYIYVVDGVIESNKNMAEIINTNSQMSKWAELMNRFSTPRPATGSTLTEYQRLYNTTDTVYVLRYFSKASRGVDLLNKTTDSYSVPATLSFDPGLNQYMWTNSMGYDMHYDAGAMIVPTNAALEEWWESGEGLALRQEYKEWDSIPIVTLSKLLNVNMLTSFIDAVPSKFNSIVDDSKVELGIEKSDVVKCFMGCNGVIYMVDKVFAPSEYRSVVFPALAHQSKMSAIYYAIDNYDFGPYLNSMESKFALILPYNDDNHLVVNSSTGESSNAFYYLDPCHYGSTQQVLWAFYYDEDDQAVSANRYTCNFDSEGNLVITGELTSTPSSSLIENRLEDLVNNLIIVTDSDGVVLGNQEYYMTKGGSALRITQEGGQIMLQGGLQIEKGQKVPVDTVYNMKNGVSYGVTSKLESSISTANMPPLTASKSVVQVLKENVDAGGDSLFYNLLAEDVSTSSLLKSSMTYSSTAYYCANESYPNIGLFENYNYTVYVPSDTSIQRLIDEGYLPAWSEWESLTDAADYSTLAKAIQDTIATVIHNFVRYHFQDNSIYVGGTPVCSTKYETGKLNPKTNRFYSVTVTASANDLSVTDQLGNERKLVKTDGLWNKACREYWLSGKSTATTRTIYTSSNAVVHQIDGCLLFDSSLQFVPWKDKLTDEQRTFLNTILP